MIVSGLALGIDGVAHQAAINSELKTVAVLPSGLDNASIYPASHQALARELLAANGVLVSEFDTNHRPYKHDFPARNRIMAGLCHAVLVVEAKPASGTQITARLALDYNRDILAVPGSIFSQHSIGTHELIRDGAAIISKSEDIIHTLGLKHIDCSSKKSTTPDALSPLEEKILRALSEPLSRTALFKLIDAPAHDIHVALSLLEIKKHITESAGLLRQKFA